MDGLTGWVKCVFHRVNGVGYEYVVYSKGKIDTLEFMKAHPDRAKQCDGYGFNDNSDEFWACYCEDTMDPPVTIVRESEDNAISAFVESNPTAWGMSDADVAERENNGLGETIGYTDGGRPYDQERIQMFRVRLVRVEF